MTPTTPLKGRPAPHFVLKAIASGRIFNLAGHAGRPVLLLFVDHHTARATREVVISLRQRYPDFDQLPVALVVDLRIIPAPLRGTAERFMESAYRQAATEVPGGFDPADHLILLPDWNGDVVGAYGIGNVSRHMQLVLIGPDGIVRATYHGPEPARHALKLVGPLLSTD